jgi:hypothetical protein
MPDVIQLRMVPMLTAIQIKPDVYWVGALDWNARSFHGYKTEDGITYNAYLILDEKVTLIDTAKVTFKDELSPASPRDRPVRRSTSSSATTWRWTTPATPVINQLAPERRDLRLRPRA